MAHLNQTVPQAGILNRPPEHLVMASLRFIETDPAAVAAALESLREVVKDELTSDLDPLGDPAQPPAETGELGFAANHDRAHLTITIGFASTAYDKLAIPATDHPQDLVAIPWGLLTDTPEIPDSGDLSLQVCADNAFITEHVLRRVEHQLAQHFKVVWAHTGAQRYTSRPGRTARHEGRAWLGFLDGTSNLNPTNDPGDAELTFVDPDNVSTYPQFSPPPPATYGQPQGPNFPGDLRVPPSSEPEWIRNGSYQAVRVSTLDLASWDADSLDGQQHTIGRTKVDGISLDVVGQDGATATTPPAFATNQSDTAVPVTAHFRRANPRGPGDDLRRIFRRGYPLYEGGNAGLVRGLVFISYGRTLSTQFEFIFRAWLTNPDFPFPGAGVDALKVFEKQVLTGGYYFVPPLTHTKQPWSWAVPTSTATTT